MALAVEPQSVSLLALWSFSTVLAASRACVNGRRRPPLTRLRAMLVEGLANSTRSEWLTHTRRNPQYPLGGSSIEFPKINPEDLCILPYSIASTRGDVLSWHLPSLMHTELSSGGSLFADFFHVERI